MKKVTKQDAINKLKAEQFNDDTESAHQNADNILCEFLISIGHKDVVAEYEKINKYYS